jgi:acetyltransferase
VFDKERSAMDKALSELQRTHRLEDGTPVVIRPIRPEDAAMERAFIRRLSDRSRYYRFLIGRGDVTEEMLERFTHIDYGREMALVATLTEEGKEREIAVGRFVPYRDGAVCEFALVVEDAWQRRGIGYQILSDLIRIAASRGYATMKGLILTVNREMIELARFLGFEIRKVPGDASLVEAVKDLR